MKKIHNYILNIYFMFSILLIGYTSANECTLVDPFSFGDCDIYLGYGWTEEGCLSISGCDAGDNEDFLFSNEEVCNIACLTHSNILGDLNDDLYINILDIQLLINYILTGDDNSLTLLVGDLVTDGAINVLMYL